MILERLYRLRLKEREGHVRGEGVYWVTDLTRCPLKRAYELAYPEVTAIDLINPTFILGELVHRGLQALMQGEGFRAEVEGERVVEVGGSKVTVRGRVDLVLDGVGVEVKYARSDQGIPHQHHVDQCRLYNWLMGLERTILLYVTPDRVCEHVVEDRADDGEVAQRIMDDRAPRYEWECEYCIFARVCSRRGRSRVKLLPSP